MEGFVKSNSGVCTDFIMSCWLCWDACVGNACISVGISAGNASKRKMYAGYYQYRSFFCNHWYMVVCFFERRHYINRQFSGYERFFSRCFDLAQSCSASA